MTIENNVYSNFKSYNQYVFQKRNNINTKAKNIITPNKKKKDDIKQSAFVGAVAGTILASMLSKKTPKVLSKILSKDIKKDSILADYINIILMAAGANIGGVIGGSKDADKEQKNKKWKECAFQIMNISIPMTLVTIISAICKNTKFLNNNPCKIIGSITGMLSGAFLATQITNATKKENEEKRKYTIKDTTANFDDVVATIKIGFKGLAEKIPVDTILPFIYVYAGSRAGSKE